MRWTSLLAALIFLSVLPASANEGAWHEYSFPEARFAAQFPSRPKVEERSYTTVLTLKPVKERVYSANSGGVTYMVAVADFTAVKPIENRAIDEAARALISKGMLTHDGSARIDWYYGRQMRVEDGSGTSYTSTIFFISNKVYHIQVIYPPMNTDPAGSSGIHFFQNTFRLL